MCTVQDRESLCVCVIYSIHCQFLCSLEYIGAMFTVK